MSKRRPHIVNYAEGDCFLVTLENGGYVRGVVARANSKNYCAFSYFFLPRYDNIIDAVIDDYLIPKNSLHADFHSDWGLCANRWKVIGKVFPWIREDWSLPVFGFLEPIVYAWGELRYRDDKTLESCRNVKVPLKEIQKVIYLPTDGAASDRYLDGRLDVLMKRLPQMGIDPHAIPPQDFTPLLTPEQINTRSINKGFVPLFDTEADRLQERLRRLGMEINERHSLEEYIMEQHLSKRQKMTDKIQSDSSFTKILKRNNDQINPIRDILWKLLGQLEILAESHGEVYDTDVRDQLHLSIWEGFVLLKKNYKLPSDFKMFSKSGNRKVRSIIKNFLELALPIVSEKEELQEPLARLRFFQDDSVKSRNEEKTYDEFFGYLDEGEAQKRIKEMSK